MQPESKDAAYLWDMLDAARAIQRFVASHSFEDYGNDRMLRGAVERHLELSFWRGYLRGGKSSA